MKNTANANVIVFVFDLTGQYSVIQGCTPHYFQLIISEEMDSYLFAVCNIIGTITHWRTLVGPF